MNNDNEKKLGQDEELENSLDSFDKKMEDISGKESEEKAVEEKTEDNTEDSTEETTEETMLDKSPDLLTKSAAPKKTGFLRSNKFRHGGMATAFTAGFIVVILLLNMVVSLLGERFPSINIDLTGDSSNSLSDDAKEVIDSVKLPTTITILGNEKDVKADAQYSSVATIASKMQERNSNIKLEFVDLDANPTYASKYQGEQLGTGNVVISTEKRHRILNSTDLFSTDTNYQTGQSTSYNMVNGAMAAAISQANSEKLPLAAFATGHDEQVNLSSFKSVLTGNNFETVDFNILTDEIPENTQLIVLATPSRDYTEEELKKLDTFLANENLVEDRSVLVTFTPGVEEMPNLATFLAEWGMAVPQAVIMETDGKNLSMNDPSYILAQTGVDSEVDLQGETSDYGYVTMPMACPVDLLFKSQDGVSTHALAASYDTAYLFDGTEPKEAPPTQSYTTLAIGQKYVTVDNKSHKGSVVVSGSSYAFANGIVNASAFGNSKYLTDVVNYVTGNAGNTSGVYIEKVQTNVADITMSAGAVTVLGLWLFTILIPLGVLLAGFVVFLKRRHL